MPILRHASGASGHRGWREHLHPRSAPTAHRRGRDGPSRAGGPDRRARSAPWAAAAPASTSSSRSAAAATSPCSARRAVGTASSTSTGPRRDRRVGRRRRRLRPPRAPGPRPRRARRMMRFGAADLATSSHRGQAVEVLAALDQRRALGGRRCAPPGRRRPDLRGARPSVRRPRTPPSSTRSRLATSPSSRPPTSSRRPASAPSGSAASARSATIPGVVAAGVDGLLFARARRRQRDRVPPRPGPGSAARPRPRRTPSRRPGANSYLGFQLQRVNGLLANDNSRKALMDVAGARRQALAEWQQLAGDIPVDWALANREEVAGGGAAAPGGRRARLDLVDHRRRRRRRRSPASSPTCSSPAWPRPAPSAVRACPSCSTTRSSSSTRP